MAKDRFFEGIFSQNNRGFGFVEVEGLDLDFFIPHKHIGEAFHGDLVLIEELKQKKGRRREARIVKVLDHRVQTVVGTFIKSPSFGFVRSDDRHILKDIYVPRESSMDAPDGAKVVCEITSYSEGDKGPCGVITDIIGRRGEPFSDLIALAMAHGMPMDFPDEVKKEVIETIPKEVKKRDLRGRLDLRDELIITIDGDDSKDFDDAISLKRIPDGYELGVHIADVSHYVKEDSPLDKEAQSRTTSVYLPGMVIPMLPKELSNGICSLNEGVDRLTLSCIMEMDRDGRMISSRIENSVIRSSRRMTYNEVNRILADTDCAEAIAARELMPLIFTMKELSDKIYALRMKRGAVELDIPEAKVYLDKRGRTKDIQARARGDSERIIEEFMVAANEAVASTCFHQDLPFLYRSHPAPELQKIKDLAALSALFGFTLKGDKKKIHPGQLQKLLYSMKGKPGEILISMCTLRSMQQAKYSDGQPSHFALASEYYCHFTSPIRRYPDLMIHRIIKEELKKPLSKKCRKHYLDILPGIATKTSAGERSAVECERDANRLKMCEYMEDKLGEEYEGFISGVTAFGIFVQLPNTVEGMVPIHTISGDRFVYLEKEYAIVGERTGRRYTMGDSIKVRVVRADKELRIIDFGLVENGKGKRKNNRHK